MRRLARSKFADRMSSLNNSLLRHGAAFSGGICADPSRDVQVVIAHHPVLDEHADEAFRQRIANSGLARFRQRRLGGKIAEKLAEQQAP